MGSVRQVTGDSTGTTWIGASGGIFRVNRDDTTYLNLADMNEVVAQMGSFYTLSLYVSHSSILWAGTRGRGVVKVTRIKKPFLIYDTRLRNADGQKRYRVSAITELDNQYWFGTRGGAGLHRFDGPGHNLSKHGAQPVKGFSVAINEVEALEVDKQNRLWIGVWNLGGLVKYRTHKNRFKRYVREPGNKNSLSNSSLYDVAADSSRLVWLATDGGGLNSFDPSTETFTPLPPRHKRSDFSK